MTRPIPPSRSGETPCCFPGGSGGTNAGSAVDAPPVSAWLALDRDWLQPSPQPVAAVSRATRTRRGDAR